ncbi:MAG: ABC transporter substrate-binding protein [Deltaproteobacteria bacterium]|nr:ABC transporter substrate-binding protein [Deltaproteobacteria bacterium]
MNAPVLSLALLLTPAANAGAPADVELASRKPQLLAPRGAPPAPSAPRRIVSLAPVVTETLFLLGQGERVVGVTRFCDTPSAAQALPKVGGYVDVSLEQILTLSPDLVMAMPSLGQREILERMRDAGVPVLVLFGDTLAEVRELVGAVGAATGASARATAVTTEIDNALGRFAAARPGAHSGRVLAVVGVRPIVVAGPGSFIGELFAQGAVTNAVAAGAPQWPTWSLERLSRRHVDTIVVAAGQETKVELERMLADAFPAAERPRLVVAAGPILMRPGPAIGRDLDALAALLRPASGAP